MRSSASIETKAANRDALLDAAEEVIVRQGIGSLSFEIVAKEAKLSKSGLLHHFPTKDALIDALVARKVCGHQADYEAAIKAQPVGPGRASRAVLGLCLSSTDKWTETVRRRGLVMMAALVHNPAHIEPLRAFRRELSSRVGSDGLPAGVGEAVRLAIDGLWFTWIFGLSELTPSKLAAVRGALERLLEASVEKGDASARKRPASKRSGRS